MILRAPLLLSVRAKPYSRLATPVYLKSLRPSPTPTLPPSTLRRSAATSAIENKPVAGSSVLVSGPTKEELEREEVDLELLKDPNIRITEAAAEQLRTIAMREQDPYVALRVAVESGGCHGYQYKIELTTVKGSDGVAVVDYHFEHPNRHPSHVVVDPVSLTLLKGATIDFATELIGSSFRIVDNPQAESGCGCGVSWEAKF